MWREESQEVKLAYQELAKEAKAKHKLQYPDYKYEPVSTRAVSLQSRAQKAENLQRSRRGERKQTQRNGPYAVPSRNLAPAEEGFPQSNFVWTYTPAPTPSSSGSTPLPAGHFYAGPAASHAASFEPPGYYNRGLPQGFNVIAGQSVGPTQMASVIPPPTRISVQNWLPTPAPNQQTYGPQVPVDRSVQYGYDPVAYAWMLQMPPQQITQVCTFVL